MLIIYSERFRYVHITMIICYKTKKRLVPGKSKDISERKKAIKRQPCEPTSLTLSTLASAHIIYSICTSRRRALIKYSLVILSWDSRTVPIPDARKRVSLIALWRRKGTLPYRPPRDRAGRRCFRRVFAYQIARMCESHASDVYPVYLQDKDSSRVRWTLRVSLYLYAGGKSARRIVTNQSFPIF